MRRLVILALLFVGMQLILPLGTAGQGSQALLAFGFLILAAYTVGEIATSLKLPKIVGYLVAGVVFGPSAFGIVSTFAADRLTPVSQLAIALIAFLAGAELRWKEVREHGVALLKITGTELLFGFVALSAVLYALHPLLPFLRDRPAVDAVAVAVLFGSIAIVHSPAVTMALLTETGARGPVARTTLGIVLAADVAVVLLFSAALTFARALVPPTGVLPSLSVGTVVWEIAGAMVVGAALGVGVALYLRFIRRELLLFGILVAFFGMEIVRLTGVELLLTLLTAGFVAENTSAHGEELRRAIERAAAPVFVVFFALAGARIELDSLARLFPLIAPIALVRVAVIRAGTRVGARWAKVSEPEQKYVWLGLVSQAGVAIGLANIVAAAYGEMGGHLRTLLLALIAVNTAAGSILFRRALVKSGESLLAERPEPAAAAARPEAARGDD